MLQTKDHKEALPLIEIMRQAAGDAVFHRILLKTCLAGNDPLLALLL